jgi:hypothetical protein
MQSRVFLPLFAAAALFATAAAAEPYAQARLAAPLPAPKTVVVGGLEWTCTADACVAKPKGQVASWSLILACKKVSGAFGVLASYASRGMALDAGDLALCNKAARAS